MVYKGFLRSLINKCLILTLIVGGMNDLHLSETAGLNMYWTTVKVKGVCFYSTCIVYLSILDSLVMASEIFF